MIARRVAAGVPGRRPSPPERSRPEWWLAAGFRGAGAHRALPGQTRGCSPARGSQVLKGVALLVVLATSWVNELIVV